MASRQRQEDEGEGRQRTQGRQALALALRPQLYFQLCRAKVSQKPDSELFSGSPLAMYMYGAPKSTPCIFEVLPNALLPLVHTPVILVTTRWLSSN